MENLDIEKVIFHALKGKTFDKDYVQESLGKYQDLCVLDNGCYENIIGLGVFQLLSGDISAGGKTIDGASKQAPNNGLVWAAVGLKSMKICAFKTARDAFEAFLHYCPNSMKIDLANIKTLDCFVEERLYKECIEHANLILGGLKQKYHNNLYCTLGYCYEKLDLQSKSTEYYSLVSSSPTNLGRICEAWMGFKTKNYSKAFEILKESFPHQIPFSQSWIDHKYLIANCYYFKGCVLEASNILFSILVPNPHLDLALCMLGKICKRFNNIYESFWFYLKAATINPRRPEIWYNLGHLYQSVNQPDADSAFEKADQLDIHKTLPQKPDKSSELLDITMNLSKFGENFEIKTKDKEKLQMLNNKEHRVNKPSEPYITVPQTINYEGNLVSDEFLYTRESSLPGGVKEQWLDFVKSLNGFINTQRQAANILSDIKSLPCKRQRF